MSDEAKREPVLMEADAGDSHALVDVPCMVCGNRHTVLVSEKNRAQWERAMLTRCPDADEQAAATEVDDG